MTSDSVSTSRIEPDAALVVALGVAAVRALRAIDEIIVVATADEVRKIYHDPTAPLKQLETKGSVLVGDVQPEDVKEKAGAYTPVPGGVGPLTIALLMANTVQAAKQRRGGRAA